MKTAYRIETMGTVTRDILCCYNVIDINMSTNPKTGITVITMPITFESCCAFHSMKNLVLSAELV